MSTHKNARTTPHGRAVMVRRVEAEGWTAAAVAEAFAVSERTVRKWLARYRAEGVAGLQDRPSRARRVVNRLAEAWVDMVLRLRRDTG
jgi:transposase